MPDAPSYEQLLTLVGELLARVAEQGRVIAVQADRIAELQRRLEAGSSNSSRSPSSDAPWDKMRAKKRSSRTRSGRNPGKQPGAEGSSRSLLEDPDRVVVISPAHCGGAQGRWPMPPNPAGSGVRWPMCAPRRHRRSPSISGCRRAARAADGSPPLGGMRPVTSAPRSLVLQAHRCGSARTLWPEPRC